MTPPTPALVARYAFNCFARLARVPDKAEAPHGSMPSTKSAGSIFRRDHADVVQIALNMLVDNSKRELPRSSTAEREQKNLLSSALAAFLRACSGPAEGREEDESAPPVWAQAVSILQMRDSTQQMVEVMKNEEENGDTHIELNIERSALANTVEPLLFTLPSIALKSDIKAKLLNRLAELLEGEYAEGAAEGGGGGGGGGDFHDGLDAAASRRMAKRRREQQHVAFMGRDGVDLVLTQLENEMSELRQIMASVEEGDDDGDDDGANGGGGRGGADEILPREARPEAAARQMAKVTKFVEREENRAELLLMGGDESAAESRAQEDANATAMAELALKASGISVLYSPALHLMPDIGDGPGTRVEETPTLHTNVMTERHKTADELAAEAEIAEIWSHAEAAVGAALRVLTACVKYGSNETSTAFLERIAQPDAHGVLTTAYDVLLVAGHVGIFRATKPGSEATLRFVRFWNVTLHEFSSRNLGIDLRRFLPLLDSLGRVLPRLLVPYVDRMAQALDLWKLRGAAEREHANEELLRGQANVSNAGREIQMIVQLAALYSTMLAALEKMRFSREEPIDVAAKELCMRRLLPPGVLATSAMASGPSSSDNALMGFLTALFYDSVLRMAEGWEESPFLSRASASLARQEAVAAIKAVLGTFCVLDEERRFELFQASARLEARWMLALPPALMQSITQYTEEKLYKRALEPYLLKSGLIEPEGEFVIDAAWVQLETLAGHNWSLSRRTKVLLIVTTRALYLCDNPTFGACSVCESWKMCPYGPTVFKRIPIHRIQSLTLDFTCEYGAGHRLKLIALDLEGGDSSIPSLPRLPGLPGLPRCSFGGLSFGCPGGGSPRSCIPGMPSCDVAGCFGYKVERLPPSERGAFGFVAGGDDRLARGRGAAAQKERSSSSSKGDASAAGDAAAAPAKPKAGRAVMTIQVSSFFVGVAQRIVKAIQYASPGARGPTVRNDMYSLRAIQLKRAQTRADQAFRSGRALVNRDAADLGDDLPGEEVHIAIRCLLVDAKGNATQPRLLLLTSDALEVHKERPELFDVPPAKDVPTALFSGHDGEDVLSLEMTLPLADLGTLDLQLSAQPRVRLEARDSSATLEFADDTGAMLFRHRIRSALWGRGAAKWTGISLAGADKEGS